MNIKQKLLFARVGFTPAVLILLNKHCGDKPINERTARYWVSGEKEPKNPYYLQTAYRLDSHLTQLAYRIVSESDEQIVLPYYINNDDYWAKTNDTSCFVSVYYQLLQRIEILSDKPVVYDNNIATLAVNFDLTL